MFERITLSLSGLVLMFIVAFPRCATAQALQEIRIGSSVIGFSSLMSYFARDLKFFEKEGFDGKIIYAQTVVLAALTAGEFRLYQSRYLRRGGNSEGNAAASHRGDT